MTDQPPPTKISIVTPKRRDGGISVVILDRVEDVAEPDYCVHGQTECYRCHRWCWLGDQTYQVAVSGDAVGLCQPCGDELGVGVLGEPTHRVEDHLRADGPH